MRTALIALILLAPASALAHGKSKSFAEWSLRSHGAELRINFGGHDVAVAVPGIDVDGDGQVSPAELEAKRALVGQRTIDHTVFAAAEEGAPVPCQGRDAEVRGIGDPVVSEIQVRAQFDCEQRLAKVHVESRQLPELEPPHVTVATFLSGKTTAQHVFSVVSPAYDLDVEIPSLAEELGTSALAGARSLVAPAVLLFLLGLLLFERAKQATLLFALYLAAFQIAGIGFPISPAPWWAGVIFALAVAYAGLELMLRRAKELPKHKLIAAPVLGAWFGAVLAPKVDLPNRLSFALGESAVALAAFALCAVLATMLGDRTTEWRRPVGIAWLCGAGALTVLAIV